MKCVLPYKYILRTSAVFMLLDVLIALILKPRILIIIQISIPAWVLSMT
jgi:hypothetical protein